MPDAYQIKDQNAMYFLTFQVVSWLDVFSRKSYKDIFIGSLNYCRKNKGLEVFAFVMMTNHVHLILRSKCGKLSDTIRDLKKFTTNTIIDEIKKDKESRRKWLLTEMTIAASKHKRNVNY